MTSAETIWHELAYPDIWSNYCNRPAILKEDLEEFSHQYSPTEQIPRLARIYLNLKRVTVVHQKKDGPQVCQDYEKTQQLVMKAFRLIRNATNDEAAEANEVSPQAQTCPVSSGQIPVDNQVSEPSHADLQPKIELVGPAAPVSSHTKMGIVVLVNKWIEAHPNLRVPVLSRYDKINLENAFATEATLTENGERVWILRLGIVDLYQGWVLEKADGICILVKAHYTRKHGCAYYRWIGGEDFAFSDDITADHKVSKKKIISIRRYAKIKGLDPDDVLNDYDISKAALEGMLSEKPQAEVIGLQGDDSDSPLSSILDPESQSQGYGTVCGGRKYYIKYCSKKRKFFKQTRACKVLPESDSDSSEPLAVKKARRPSLKANAPGHTHGSTSPGNGIPTATRSLPIPSAKHNPKTHSSHDFTTPSHASNVQSQALGPTVAPQKSIHPATYPTPEPSQPPADPQQFTRPDLANFTYTLPTGTYKVLNSPGSLGPHPIPTLNANPFPTTASNPLTSLIPTKPSQIKLHYFLSNPNDGAIPHSYTALPTKEKFFRDAVTAYNTANHNLWAAGNTKPNVVAASIRFADMDTPLVVPVGKQGKEAWEEVRGCVEELMIGGGGRVRGGVRVLVGG